MVPTIEGEFARKRRMMIGALGHRRRATGCWHPRGYPPALRASRSSRTGCCATRAPFLHVVALVANARAARRGPGLRRRARRPARRCSRAAAARRRGSARSARCRIARYYVLVTASIAARPLGPPAPAARRRESRLGRPGRAGTPLMRAARAATVARRGRSAPARRRCVAAVSAAARRDDRDPARQPRPGRSTASAGSAADGARVRDAQAADDGAGRRPGRRRHRGQRGRPARHPGRPGPAAHLARRGAEPRQRAARRDGDRRPAPDDPGPGRALHAAPAPPPRGAARDHRLGAGQRPRRDPLGASGSSSTSGTSSTARRALDLRDPRPHRRPGGRRRRASTRAEPRPGFVRADDDRARLRGRGPDQAVPSRTTGRRSTAGSTTARRPRR